MKQIVLWKLGCKEGVVPSQDERDKLQKQVDATTDGGNIVCGPDLSVEIITIGSDNDSVLRTTKKEWLQPK